MNIMNKPEKGKWVMLGPFEIRRTTGGLEEENGVVILDDEGDECWFKDIRIHCFVQPSIRRGQIVYLPEEENRPLYKVIEILEDNKALLLSTSADVSKIVRLDQLEVINQ